MEYEQASLLGTLQAQRVALEAEVAELRARLAAERENRRAEELRLVERAELAERGLLTLEQMAERYRDQAHTAETGVAGLERRLEQAQTDYRQLREAMSAAEDQTDAYRRRLQQLGRQLAEALGADPATPWTELVAAVRAQRRDLALEVGEDPDARP